MSKHCLLCNIVFALLVIGALNWGLVGAFHFNLVDHLFGAESIASRVIYSVVGLSGLLALVKCFSGCPSCKEGKIE